MRLLAIITFALLYTQAMQAQKIGQGIKNQLFAKALIQECPQCVDQRGRLTKAAAEVENLVLDFEAVALSSWYSDWLLELGWSKPKLAPISFESFSKLKSLEMKYDFITIAAWPPNLQILDATHSEFAEPLPMLPAGLKTLHLGSLYRTVMEGNFDKERFFIEPLPAGLEEIRAEQFSFKRIPSNLPASLKTLYLSSGGIDSISNLPPNLNQLILYNNHISQLDGVVWPESLRVLNLTSNPISELPKDWGNCKIESLSLNNLPAGYVKNNGSLELRLPASLLELSIAYCNLAALSGEFPQGLRQLRLSSNALRKLPPLPASLRDLSIDQNKLDSLHIGHTELHNLITDRNELVYIDKFPTSLVSIDCGGNQLHSLPNLPNGLKKLTCAGNRISVFPDIPAGIEELRFDNNPISASPKIPAGLKAINQEKTIYEKK